MAKFSGMIGYAVESEETEPSVWKDRFCERKVHGDILEDSRSIDSGDKHNDDIDVSVQISVVADTYGLSHFFAIRYVVWNGLKWKVRKVKPVKPRLLITLGGLYNENEA